MNATVLFISSISDPQNGIIVHFERLDRIHNLPTLHFSQLFSAKWLSRHSIR